MMPEWTTEFLASLATTPNVSEAARDAGITRQAAYAARHVSPEFAAAWDDALASSTDDLVGMAWKRAKSGDSDLMTIFMLKAHRPEVYREKYEPVKQQNKGKLPWSDVKEAHRKRREEAKLRRGSR